MPPESNPPLKISREEARAAFREKDKPTNMWDAFSELEPFHDQIHFNHSALHDTWGVEARTIGGVLVEGQQYPTSRS